MILFYILSVTMYLTSCCIYEEEEERTCDQSVKMKWETRELISEVTCKLYSLFHDSFQDWRPLPRQQGNDCWCQAGGVSFVIPITSVTSSWLWRGPFHVVRQLKRLKELFFNTESSLNCG